MQEVDDPEVEVGATLEPTHKLISVVQLRHRDVHLQQVARDQDHVVDMLLLVQVAHQLVKQFVLVDDAVHVLELRDDLQAEGDLVGWHFAEFLVEVEGDEALVDVVDPAELLGDEALEVGGAELGHQLLLAPLVHLVLHLAVEQEVDLLLRQQVHLLVAEEVAQALLPLQLLQVLELVHELGVGVELAPQPLELLGSGVDAALETVGRPEEGEAKLSQHDYNSGKYGYNHPITSHIQIIMAQSEENAEEEIVVPSVLKANTSVGKNSFLRDMIGLKTLMEKRLEQRGLTLYYLSNKKFQSALIYCRQLTFSSMKIYKEYSDQYNDEFEENFFSRTCKAKEHLEYLLDCIIACRVFIEAKKKEDAIDILEKVELNQNQKEKQIIVKTQADKVKFNEQHEIMSKMCAALLSFIEIAKSEKLYDYCEKYFKIYVNYVKNNYGIIEYSTALFKYGNYLYQTKNYESSEENFKTCVEIRKNNVINSCLVDALLNLSICQRELAQYEEAIKNTKEAIQIYKDIKINDQGIDHYYLFLAKLLLQYAQFEQAYANYLKCFKYRQQYDNSHPGKIQIQLNMMMFYKILKDVTEKHREILNIQDKKLMEERRREATEVYSKMKNTILQREQFSKYRDFKSSRFSHLNLFISKDFFDSLSSHQIIQLNSLLSKLGDLTFARGMAELQKCSFFQEKKLRDLLIETNGHLKKGHARKTNSEIGSSKAFI